MKREKAGFTLIEALVTMALLAVFLTIMTTLFTTAIDLQSKSTGSSAVLSDGQFMMARLDYDISRASAISTPATLGSSAVTLVMTINATTYTYVLSGNSLQLTDGTGSDNLNGNRTIISNLNFQRLGNAGGKESVRYTFTVTGTVAHTGGSDTQTFTSTVERK